MMSSKQNKLKKNLDYMENIEFMGKLLNAVDAAIQEHKNAKNKDEYLYTQGKMDAFKKVVEWIKS